MRARITAMVIILGATLALFAYQTTWAATPAPQAIKNPNIIIGSGLAGPYVPYPVAIEKGFFTKHGLNAQMRIFASGFEAVQAVGARAIHISSAGEFSVIVPRSRGADLVVVGRNIVNGVGGLGGIDSISWGDLGVGAVRAINGPKDLVGKKCGVLIGGTSEWYAYRYITAYRIDPKDVTFVNIAAPEWLPAMVRGDIQCFFGWEPWLTELPRLVPGGHVIHRNGKDNVYILQNMTTFNATWVKEDPEGAKAALRAWIDTMKWVNVNRQEAANIAAKAFQADPTVLARQMDCCVYKVDFPQQLVDVAVEMAKWGSSRGLLAMNVDQLVSVLLFPDLMKAVAPDRCTADICKKGSRM